MAGCSHLDCGRLARWLSRSKHESELLCNTVLLPAPSPHQGCCHLLVSLEAIVGLQIPAVDQQTLHGDTYQPSAATHAHHGVCSLTQGREACLVTGLRMHGALQTHWVCLSTLLQLLAGLLLLDSCQVLCHGNAGGA